MIKNQSFASQFRLLLKTVNMKNSTLAMTLQYDVSYISKWTSGKILPSEKNIDEIVSVLLDSVLGLCSEKELLLLRQEYAVSENQGLEVTIKEALLEAYYRQKEPIKINDNLKSLSNSYIPVSSTREVIQIMDLFSFEKEGNANIIVAIDIFALDGESRLLFAGMENSRCRLKRDYPNVKLSIIINLDLDELDDCIYNGIFLIHMLTSFSYVQTDVYLHTKSKEKIMYSLQDKRSVVTVLMNSNKCLSVNTQTELETVNRIYDELKFLIAQEYLAFRKTTMKQMLIEHEYLKSIISTKIRWLLGHMTELLMPSDLFREVCYSLDISNQEQEEMFNAHLVLQSIFELGNIQIMIYESAISSFVMSGELDFFNQKIILDPGQRVKILSYLSGLIGKAEFDNYKMIEGGFSNDFLYITNPCLFIAETLCYLRLENNMYKNNILIASNKTIQEFFENLYNGIWTNREDVVISNQKYICEKIEHYKKSAEMLANIK